jgi:hypothetical protein
VSLLLYAMHEELHKSIANRHFCSAPERAAELKSIAASLQNFALGAERSSSGKYRPNIHHVRLQPQSSILKSASSKVSIGGII